MTCKTREAALRGERKKLHIYLPTETDKVFQWCLPKATTYKKSVLMSLDLSSFEKRIDWSTWGWSR